MQNAPTDPITRFGLQPHPEGGWYKRIHTSSSTVQRQPDGANRPALSQIYYYLRGNEFSRFHRVQNDESWNLFEGNGIEILEWTPGLKEIHHTRLQPDGNYIHVVPAGTWQAARPLDGNVLVGCAVGPGFDFADFTLAHDHPDIAAAILRIAPHFEAMI